MNYDQICDEIKNKRSYLCIGLDSDLDKIPKHLLKYKDPIFEFNKLVVDATKDIVIAYKPNLAFYEVLGSEGIKTLQKTINYLPDNIFKIADAKRGDIGNTSIMYAKTFFETLDFDAVTLSPYMGKDSVDPYLDYKNKWAIILALTSNESAKEIQLISSDKGEKLYESVINDSLKWSNPENLMYVVWANREEDLLNIRKKASLDLSINDIDDEDFCSYLMYPKVFQDYLTHHSIYGPVRCLPTNVFFYGMENSQEISVEIDPGKILEIRLQAVSEVNDEGDRKVFFE